MDELNPRVGNEFIAVIAALPLTPRQIINAEVAADCIDEAVLRLQEGDDRRFVCFTFNDGYRDNLQYAYPMFKRRLMPLTLYVPTDYPDGNGELWWLALEEIVARAHEIELCRNGESALPAGTVPGRQSAGDLLVAPPHRRGDPAKWYACSPTATGGHGRGLLGCDELGRDQDHGRRSARHCRRAHQRLAFQALRIASLRGDGRSTDRIERSRVRPIHFSYPYGDPGAGRRDFAPARQVGFQTAVTTRKACCSRTDTH
jgi:peptidoglycan/xylan/chitin deacetylase (PgdA/CDA1 family)